MNKSQLRRLASEFSQGKVARDEYRRRRKGLLDGIAAGDISIEREMPPVSEPMEQTSRIEVFAPETNKLQPVLYAAVGLAVLVVLGGLAWMLLQPDSDNTQGNRSAGTRTIEVPVAVESPARTLIESFVAVRDWSAASVADFKSRWDALSDEQRKEAQDAIWFKRLTKAFRDELKTQKALLEFDKTGKARETGMRIVALADHVGTSGSLPGFPAATNAEPTLPRTNASPTPAAPMPEKKQGGVSGAAPVTEQGSAATTAVASSTGTPVRGIPTSASPQDSLPLPGPTWLAGLAPSAHTLQLFAVNRLDKVAALRLQHPTLALKILDFPNHQPRYRMLYGAYENETDARQAYAELPAEIRAAQPQAYVKSVRELQALGPPGLRGPGAVAASEKASPATTDEAAAYTLQVFASSNIDNVEQLVSSHPGLELQVRETVSNAARYRVIYGQFESQASAEAAANKLPSAILSRTGRPIVKSLADLEALRRR